MFLAFEEFDYFCPKSNFSETLYRCIQIYQNTKKKPATSTHRATQRTTNTSTTASERSVGKTTVEFKSILLLPDRHHRFKYFNNTINVLKFVH